ncbi:MAG: ABC transporter permease [Spirochaetales bacterium]|nr:ABC transporter permease [Spirochaetales bacterium]
MKLSHIALRNIMRNRRRSILSGSAIAVATMSIVLLFGMMEGMLDDMARNEQRYETGMVHILNAEFDKYARLNPVHLYIKNAEETVKAFESYPWVTAVSERINFAGRIYQDNREYNVFGKGVDFSREKDFEKLDEVLVAGRLPDPGSREAVIGVKLAAELGIDLTDSEPDKITILTMKSNRTSKHFTVEVVGLLAYPVSSLNSVTLLMPLATAQDFLLMKDGLSEILLMVDEEQYNANRAAALLRDELGSRYPDLKIESWLETNLIFSMMNMAANIYNVFALFFFVLGSSVIINTTIMVIYERMQEIGTLGAMGMRGKELTRLFFLEAFFISLIGALIGTLIGIVIILAIGKSGIPLGSMMEDLEGFSMSNYLYLGLSIKNTVVVFIYSVAIASLSTFIPSRRASKIEPVEALRAI